IQLLEAIETAGSISAAARKLKMSFRRAWELLDHMNKAFGRPVVTGHAGSTGGAELTELGQDIVRRYRQIEAETLALATPHLAALDACRLAGDEGRKQTEDGSGRGSPEQASPLEERRPITFRKK
ncbi:MAG: LysR family transcriptional regulator, partial [Xanthobacteraceae bacterium]|nr:LysR family transcriptional regulator [Xanthobacteraceae bacterium]